MLGKPAILQMARQSYLPALTGAIAFGNSRSGKLIKHNQISDKIIRGLAIDPKGDFFVFTQDESL